MDADAAAGTNEADANQADADQADANQADANQADANQADANEADANQADASIRVQATREARRAFEAGRRASADERWDVARDAFARSLALAPRASTALNLAVALGHLGDDVGSLEALALVFETTAPEDPRRVRAESLRAYLLPRLFTLQLEARAPVLSVTIDGQSPRAITAGAPLYLTPGEHRVEISAPGYSATQLDVRGAAGERATRSISLPAAPTNAMAERTATEHTAAERTAAERTAAERTAAATRLDPEHAASGTAPPRDAATLPSSVAGEARGDREDSRRGLWLGLAAVAVAAGIAGALIATHGRGSLDRGSTGEVLTPSPTTPSMMTLTWEGP